LLILLATTVEHTQTTIGARQVSSRDCEESARRQKIGQAMRTALSGIGAGADLGNSRFELYPLHSKDNTFPGEVFFELAADAIEEAGASREEPIEFEGIRKRYLRECTAHQGPASAQQVRAPGRC
jgi:hypothetical protein